MRGVYLCNYVLFFLPLRRRHRLLTPIHCKDKKRWYMDFREEKLLLITYIKKILLLLPFTSSSNSYFWRSNHLQWIFASFFFFFLFISTALKTYQHWNSVKGFKSLNFLHLYNLIKKYVADPRDDGIHVAVKCSHYKFHAHTKW